MPKTLTIIDNYDSFVHTLAGYCRVLGVEVIVVRNDAISVEELSRCDAVVLSPGPGEPSGAGVCVSAIAQLESTPILGVCLGHQAIGEAFGARIGRSSPVHGRASDVFHRQEGLFAGLPNPLALTRYHSLAVFDLPECLSLDAWSSDGLTMAISHRSRPVWGIQNHPESVLSRHGHRLLANFLGMAGFDVSERILLLEQAWEDKQEAIAAENDFFAEPVRPSYPLPGASPPSRS